MSAAVPLESGVLDEYRGRLGSSAVDELVTPQGLRTDQAALGAAVEAMGLAGLQAARAEARSFASDEGVTYGTSQSGSRNWAIDPIPVLIGAAEWDELEAGLQQRSRLLDLVLSDLYGEGTLLRRRVIPPEVVLAHDGYIRQTDGIGAPGHRQLVVSATDLGRDPSGRWTVISDRTQAPSGPGYAMATRRIISRVMAGLHRGTEMARLRAFFQTCTAALQDASPSATEAAAGGAAHSRAAAARPPSSRPTWPPCWASRWSRPTTWWCARAGSGYAAGDRLEQVDVILRRVDAAYSDPLELRGDSQLGVPGLIEAARNRHRGRGEPVGAGVLENPGLTAASRRRRPRPAGRGSAAADAAHLVVRRRHRPLARPGPPGLAGAQADRPGHRAAALRLATHRRRARRTGGGDHAEPWAWCGQERMRLRDGAGGHPDRPGAASVRAAHLRRGARRRLPLLARRSRPGGRPGRRAHSSPTTPARWRKTSGCSPPTPASPPSAFETGG